MFTVLLLLIVIRLKTKLIHLYYDQNSKDNYFPIYPLIYLIIQK